MQKLIDFFKKFKKENDLWWVPLMLIGFIVIALIAFLGKGGSAVSGWQIVFNQTFGEWFRMVFFSALAGGIVWLYIKFYNRTQDTKGSFVFAVALLVFVSIAFGKACTDKANDGVTSGKVIPKK